MRRRTSTSPTRARSRRAGRCSSRSTCRRSSSSPRSGRRASSPGCGRPEPRSRCRRRRRAGLAVGLGGLGITLADLTRLYAGLARGGDVPALRAPPRRRGAARRTRRVADPVAAWYVADILRGAPPPDNALGRPHRLQDRHLLRLPRRLGGRLRPATHDRRLGRAAGRRRGAGPRRARSSPRRSCSTPSPGSAREPEPVPMPAACARRHDRGAAAAAAPPAQGRAEDRRLDDAARRSRSPSRSTARGSSSASPAPASAAPLALKAAGGVPPLTWLVNGAPVDRADAAPAVRLAARTAPASRASR